MLHRIRLLASTQGTSVPLTTAVRRVALIARLQQLLVLLNGRNSPAAGDAFAALWVELVDGETGRHSVRRFIRESTDVAAYATRNLGAIAGNTAFGFLLAFVGFFGVIAGLPLDIRHVTFSTAYVAYSSVGLDFHLGVADLAVAALGVGLVAATTLAVSFALAHSVAMRARGMRLSATLRFVGAVWRRLVTSPRAFFLPPKREPGEPRAE